MDVRVLNSIMEESRYEISFDLEYESSGSINGNSYQIEMRIPFSSLPFPNGKNQKWKFKIFRKYIDYELSSSREDRDNSCVTCQFEDDILFRDIKIDKKFDLIPYITSSIEGSNNSVDSKINYGKVKNNIGLSLNTCLLYTSPSPRDH